MIIDKGLEEQITRKITRTQMGRGLPATSEWVLRGLCAVLFIWMIAAWAHLAGTVIRYYSALPFWDYWETLPRFQLIADGHWLTGLWPQHNEHRIVFPALIFAADYRFFAGREILPLVLNVVFYVATWAVFSTVLIRSNMPRPAAVWASLIAAIIMAWEGAGLEMAGAFLIQWSLLLLANALALLSLAKVPRSARPWIPLVFTIFCAFVDTYSAANGLASWPILLIAAWLLRLSRKQIAVLGIAGAVSSGLYFVGYHVSQKTDLHALIAHPLYAAEFIGAYLGSPFTVAKLWLGIVLGWTAFIAVMASTVVAARRQSLGSSATVVFAGMYCLCLATAAMTALGRMDPTDPAFGSATAQRYIIIPLVAQVCALSIVGWAFEARRVYGGISFVFVVGLWFTSSSVIVGSWCGFVKGLLRNTQSVAVAIETGVDDARVLETVYPDLNLLRPRIEVLRQHNWSVFASPQTRWLGKPVSEVVRSVSNTGVSGAITFVRANKRDLLVKGWSEGKRPAWRPERLIFVNEQGTVVGFGENVPSAVHLISVRKMEQREWVGFVNRKYPTRTFDAYMLRDRGAKLVRIGNPGSIPAIRDASADEAGPPLGSVTWRIRGSWQKNGSLPVKPKGMPESSDYYESWNGRDANVGTMESEPFATPPGRCIVFSTANGPRVSNLALAIFDANTSSKVVSVPLDGDDGGWHFWKLDVPQSTKRLRIVAEDNGRGWGQWLSVGEVRACK